METLYDAMGGADVVLAVARAWHERVMADPVVSHAFSHGFRDDHIELEVAPGIVLKVARGAIGTRLTPADVGPRENDDIEHPNGTEGAA